MRSLIVHGGGWRIPDEEIEAHARGVAAALERGAVLLRSGASAVDVVVETVAQMESDPTFDAGCGSHLNRDGAVQMDAAVIDAASGRAGACAGVSDVVHPVRLARAILEEGRTVFLAGEGATRYARDAGIAVASKAEFGARRPTDPDRAGGTVGALCCDAEGRLAAAGSTGGVPGGLPGRVADTAILGSGIWAEDGYGAAVCTGWGEAILRDLLAFRAVRGIDAITLSTRRPRGARKVEPHPIARVSTVWGPVPAGTGRTPEALAARRAIEGHAQRVGGAAGLILLGPDGNPGFAFNTPQMARGFWLEGMGKGRVEVGT